MSVASKFIDLATFEPTPGSIDNGVVSIPSTDLPADV